VIDRFAVPVFLLRVPVRYYRSAPVYFRGWRADAPPRWGDHWGSSWEQRRSGWDRWNRRSAPAPAPLPVYQRQYSGSRYPDRSQQVVIQTRSYRYQPRETVVRQRFEQRRASAPELQRQPRAQREAPRPQAQREAPRRTTVQQAPPPPIARAPMQQGHPPGQAKGWEGADRPPGQAMGWDGASQPPGQARRAERDDDRGRGRDKDKDDRGRGRDR
jgi:hypothetical protein